MPPPVAFTVTPDNVTLPTRIIIEVGGNVYACAEGELTLAQIGDLIARFGDTARAAPEPAPETRPALAAVTPIKPAPANAAAVDGLGCPECGKACASKQGLGKHRSSAHGYKSPTRVSTSKRPAAVVVVGPASSNVGADELALRCGDGDCDFTARIHEATKLRHHTDAEHGRAPERAETTPRTVEDLIRGGGRRLSAAA